MSTFKSLWAIKMSNKWIGRNLEKRFLNWKIKVFLLLLTTFAMMTDGNNKLVYCVIKKNQ